MAKIGDVFLDVVENEDVNRRSRSTDHPVESGEIIVDHTEMNPIQMSISGVVTGEDASQRLAQLELYQRDGEILKYGHRNLFVNCLIEDFNSSHGKEVRNGFRFDIVLKKIKLAEPSTVNLLSPDLRSQVKSMSNLGRQQVMS